MRSGRDGWKKFPLPQRIKAIENSLSEGIAKNKNSGVRLFAAIIDKNALVGEDPVEHAFEQIASRFDQYLRRLYTKHNDAQRGIILFDKSTTEKRIQTLARDFKYNGHTHGKTHNYAEVPVFLDSKASRLIQLADLVSYAINRRYTQRDSQFFDIIKDCFDSEGGVVHGLYEKL
jgi:hypothetical protein